MPDPLKILHVIPGMAAEIGGPPAVCAGLTGALAARGHEVTIATLDEGSLPTVPVDPRVKLVRLAPDVPGKTRYLKSAVLDAWLNAHVREFQIVHLHSIWQFPTYAAARACWRARVPYVVLLNGMLDTYCVNERSRHIKRAYWLWREGKVEGRAAAIHCLNAAEIRRAVPWIARMPKFVVGNGIDAGVLTAMPARGRWRRNVDAGHRFIGGDADATPLVLFLSRLHPKKGLDRLLPAWKRVVEKMPAAQLLIAGTGEAAYVDSLRALAAANGLAGHVHLLGQVVGPAKWELLVDADVFVLPSHQEGFSMAITEALAAGCVPVVTEECNFDELEGGAAQDSGLKAQDSGLIIRNGDMARFADAVVELLGDAQRRQRMAAAGKALVTARFTWQIIAEEMEGNYRWILSGESFSTNG